MIGDKDGRVIGLLTGGGKDARMIGVREIASALQKAGITPRRGPIDAAFETALARFHTNYYGQAVSGFQRVLELSPGHVMAAEHLKTSLAKRGGAEDQGVARPERVRSTPVWPVVAAVATLLAAALGGVLLMRRRRSAGSDGQGLSLVPWPSAEPPLEEASPTLTVRRPPAHSFAPSLTPDSAQSHVGNSAPRTKFCTACGMQASTGHRFCGYCGHPLDA